MTLRYNKWYEMVKVVYLNLFVSKSLNKQQMKRNCTRVPIRHYAQCTFKNKMQTQKEASCLKLYIKIIKKIKSFWRHPIAIIS